MGSGPQSRRGDKRMRRGGVAQGDVVRGEKGPDARGIGR